MLGAFLGRAVIAMTAVRIGARGEPGKVTDLSVIRPPTDVMAITSLPHTPANHPVSGFPLRFHLSPPPATRGCHPPPEVGGFSYVVTRSRPYPAHIVPILHTRYSILS